MIRQTSITLILAISLLHAADIGPLPLFAPPPLPVLRNPPPVVVHADSGVWQKGVAYVRTGMITKGIALLDSLRCAGVADPAFLRAYAGCVFGALVPQRNMTADVEMILKPGPLVLTDTLTPSSHELTVIRYMDASDKNAPLPSFTYGATFELRKPFHMVFTGLSGYSSPAVRLKGAPDPVLPKLIFNQLDTRNETATCRLFIDLEDTKSPIHGYLTRRINAVYDSISTRNDCSRVNGVSIRGYTWSGRHYEDGKFAAVAAFDRLLPDLVTGRKERVSTEGRIARYTLVVRSSVASQELTEAKFQALVRALL